MKTIKEISMAKNLKLIEVTINQLFLDPNNPRFITDHVTQESRIPEEDVQEYAKQELFYGEDDANNMAHVESLKDSMRENGYVPVNNIVVRKIVGHEDKNIYVVIEGNCRTTALKIIDKEVRQGKWDMVDEKILDTFKKIPVLLSVGDKQEDYNLQGISHIMPAKRWSPVAQAKLIKSTMKKGGGCTAGEAGAAFGLKKNVATKLVQAYELYKEFKNDPEYGDRAKTSDYGYFGEALSRTKVKNWLEWDPVNSEFKNKENLKTFYKWITPDESSIHRLTMANDVRKIDALISGDHQEITDKFDQGEIDLADANAKIREKASNWL